MMVQGWKEAVADDDDDDEWVVGSLQSYVGEEGGKEVGREEERLLTEEEGTDGGCEGGRFVSQEIER